MDAPSLSFSFMALELPLATGTMLTGCLYIGRGKGGQISRRGREGYMPRRGKASKYNLVEEGTMKVPC